jgi:hypothetical protein
MPVGQARPLRQSRRHCMEAHFGVATQFARKCAGFAFSALCAHQTFDYDAENTIVLGYCFFHGVLLSTGQNLSAKAVSPAAANDLETLRIFL